MILLLDIGNTNTHLGLADHKNVIRHKGIPTAAWKSNAAHLIRRFAGKAPKQIDAACLCSVVPEMTSLAVRVVWTTFGVRTRELTPDTLRHVGIDYPRPWTIGPDRLANAAAAFYHFGGPAVVVDFGTAVTFDVVDRKGNYVGGIIAPGLSAMTDYLHEKTALLPRIKVADVKSPIGKSTRQAMLVGAVHGYRGLIRGLIAELKRELGARRLPVIATGGYASLLASRLPEITAVEPTLTLEGLRLCYPVEQPS